MGWRVRNLKARRPIDWNGTHGLDRLDRLMRLYQGSLEKRPLDAGCGGGVGGRREPHDPGQAQLALAQLLLGLDRED